MIMRELPPTPPIPVVRTDVRSATPTVVRSPHPFGVRHDFRSAAAVGTATRAPSGPGVVE